MESWRETAIAYGPMISIVGALILFFSWSVKNTLFQHYTDMRSSIQNAHSTFRLYNTLHELRNSVNSIAMEVVQEKSSTNATRFRSGITGEHDIDQIRREFDLTRLSAHQLKELADFAFKTLDLSNSFDDSSSLHSEIVELTMEIEALRDEVSSREEAAEDENNSNHQPNLEIAHPARDEYISYWRETAIKKVPIFYPQIVDLSNRRIEEAHTELRTAKLYSNWADRTVIILYVLGTLLAIGGQAASKLLTEGN